MDEGLEYMRSSQAVYDLIVLDLTDPGGPSRILHTADFYRHNAAAAIAPAKMADQETALRTGEFSLLCCTSYGVLAILAAAIAALEFMINPQEFKWRDHQMADSKTQ